GFAVIINTDWFRMNNGEALETTRREFLGAVATSAASCTGLTSEEGAAKADDFEPVKIPDWVHGVTRTAFLAPDDVPRAAQAGVQVVHTNLVWPYYPLRRD